MLYWNRFPPQFGPFGWNILYRRSDRRSPDDAQVVVKRWRGSRSRLPVDGDRPNPRQGVRKITRTLFPTYNVGVYVGKVGYDGQLAPVPPNRC